MLAVVPHETAHKTAATRSRSARALVYAPGVSVAPAARGTLRSHSLLALLLSVLEGGHGGTLVFEAPGGRSRHALGLVAGAVGKAMLAGTQLRLSQLLADVGTVPTLDVEHAWEEAQATRTLFGQVLLRRGILDEATLEEALRDQIARKVEWLAEQPGDTLYGFYPTTDFLERFGGAPTPVPPLGLLWRLARQHVPDDLVEHTLDQLGAAALRLHPQATTAAFGFKDRERGVVELLRVKPFRATELLRGGAADERTVKRVLFMLAATRHLDLGAEPLGVELMLRPTIALSEEPPSSRRLDAALRASRPASSAHHPIPEDASVAPPPPSTAHPSTSGTARPPSSSTMHAVPPPTHSQAPAVDPRLLDKRGRIESRASLLDRLSHYELLEVDPTATKQQIQAQYLKLAKELHPDRLGAGMEDLKPIATRVFSRMTEAQQVLTDDSRRADYDAQQRGGPSEEDQVAAVLNAANAHQRAEVMLKRRDNAGAEREAEKAKDLDPEQAEYGAFWAFLVAQRSTPAECAALLPVLDKAVAKEPDNARVRNYRAHVRKRAGRLEDAIADFRNLMNADPRNVDAAREVRLYTMRNAGNPPKKDGRKTDPKPAKPEENSGGLFGRFFKR